MRVKFKKNTKVYDCTEPVEQKVFRSGVAIGWAVMFNIYGAVDSSDIDSMLAPDSISELTFYKQDEDGENFAISDYNAVTACTIRHKETITVTELQLTKANKTEKEVISNG